MPSEAQSLWQQVINSAVLVAVITSLTSIVTSLINNQKKRRVQPIDSKLFRVLSVKQRYTEHQPLTFGDILAYALAASYGVLAATALYIWFLSNTIQNLFVVLLFGVQAFLIYTGVSLSKSQLEPRAEIEVEADFDVLVSRSLESLSVLDAKLTVLDIKNGTVEARIGQNFLSLGQKIRIRLNKTADKNCRLVVYSSLVKDDPELTKPKVRQKGNSNIVSKFIQQFTGMSGMGFESAKLTPSTPSGRELTQAAEQNALPVQHIVTRLSMSEPELLEFVKSRQVIVTRQDVRIEADDDPYDWGETDPKTIGKPVYFDPELGPVVEE
ncbi:hypothetical protein [Gloeobacter violaceus]|uniref:hypothetical protein n=1 Tax=Gloeobacter violaceus TaxID=33072 RepID=UPI0013E8E8F1|nr:hypothetical protein [Gloeobacter violaceus]